MQKLSEYRAHARRVIRRVLDGLPSGASTAEKRKALSQSYPFRERTGWAYKCWLKEVRLELGPYRRGTKPVQATAVQVLLLPDRVACGWCEGRQCYICYRQRRWHEELTRRGLLADALALQAAAPDKLSDWLKDKGIEEGGDGG